MTATPRNAGDPRGWAIPDGDVADEDVDVLALAGRQPPAGGAWLQVTAAEARRGGEFTALFLPRRRPMACGGDVLVRIAPRERHGQRPRRWPGCRCTRSRPGRWSASRAGTWTALTCGRRSSAARSCSRSARCANSRTTVPTSVRREQVDLVAAAGSVPAPFPGLPAR